MSSRKDSITVDSLLAELDSMRECQIHHLAVRWTGEMDKALLHARGKSPPVTWGRLVKWWRDRGWPGHSQTTLRRRLRELTGREAR